MIVWELRLGREERGWVACSVVVEGRLVLQLLLLLPPMWVGGEVGQHAFFAYSDRFVLSHWPEAFQAHGVKRHLRTPSSAIASSWT